MNPTFSLFTLSIFRECTLEEFTNAVIADWKNSLDTKSAHIQKDNLNIEQYYDAPYRFHFEKFSWWSNPRYPKTVFLSSNKRDGLDRPCLFLRRRLGCSLIKLEVSIKSPTTPETVNWFQHIAPDGEERIVYALKENRWVFCEIGTPLHFENPDYYKRKKVTERMNCNIIVEYLSKLGINLWDIDSDVSECRTYTRTALDTERQSAT